MKANNNKEDAMASKTKRSTTQTVKRNSVSESSTSSVTGQLLDELVPIVVKELQKEMDSKGAPIRVHVFKDSIDQVSTVDAILAASDYSHKVKARLIHLKDLVFDFSYEGKNYRLRSVQTGLLTLIIDQGRSRNDRRSSWLIKIDSIKEVQDDKEPVDVSTEHRD